MWYKPGEARIMLCNCVCGIIRRRNKEARKDVMQTETRMPGRVWDIEFSSFYEGVTSCQQ